LCYLCNSIFKMKKRTAIFFLMLANIIILAHTVVPHHHLPHQSFFLTAETAEDKNGHHHPILDFDHDHEHDNNSDNEHCLLNEVIGLPTNAVRQICGCDFQADLYPDFGGFQAVLLFFQFECEAPAVTLRLRPPLLTFSYISYASSVLGLRAPPAF